MANKEYKMTVRLSDGTEIDAGTFIANQGPQGPIGPTGPTGATGPIGPTGPSGGAATNLSVTNNPDGTVNLVIS